MFLVPALLLIATAASAGVISAVRVALQNAEIHSSAGGVDYQAVLPVGQSGQRDIALLDTTSGSLRPLVESPGDQFDPVWTPSGQWIYYTSVAGSDDIPAVWRVSYGPGTPQKGSSEQVSPDGLPAMAPLPSPDGAKIAFMSPADSGGGVADVWVVDADGGDAHRLLDARTAGLRDGFFVRGWSPDGQGIVGVVSRRSQNRLLELASLDLRGDLDVRESLPPVAPAGWVAMSAASQVLAYVGLDESDLSPQRLVLYVVNLKTWRLEAQWEAPPDTEVAWPAWSPDGNTVAFVTNFGHPDERCRDEGYTYPCPDLGIDVWSIDAAQPLALVSGPHAYAPFWTNPNELVFWRQDAQGTLGLWSVTLSTGDETALVTHWEGDIAEESASVRSSNVGA